MANKPLKKRIPPEIWRDVVKNVPIVSVDLVVLQRGGVVLGKRKNRPAKGEWFVPGGRVLKNESLEDAVDRIAHAELGCSVKILERLGVYEHFYEDSDVEGTNKHYVANAFVVEPKNGGFESDEQHSELRMFKSLPDDLYPYITEFLEDAGILS